jgi:Ca-activated chloride channel family protein
MNLLNPWMLTFLLSLPIILLFYLLKRTYEPYTVPSTLLWEKLLRDLEANRPWQRLRRNLLLLLQLLIAALLAFALSRPALLGSGVTAAHTIVVLDLSPSMAAKEGKSTRLTSYKEQIRELIDSLGPEQKITLIAMGREAKVAASGGDAAELREVLDALPQEYGPADYEGALSLAAALSSEDREADVRIYSDGNWGLDPKLYPRFGKTPTLILPQDAGDNFAVTHAAAVVRGEGTDFSVTVANHGSNSQRLEVEVQDEGGRILDVREVEIAAGESESMIWKEFPVRDVYRVRILQEDALAADNERIVIPSRSTSSKAWLFTKGNLFLEKALALGGRLTVENGTDPETPPQDAALYVYDGVMPTSWPNGSVLLVNPPSGVSGVLKVGEPKAPGRLETIAPDSPILKHVSLADLHLKAVRPIENAPWLQPLVRSGDTPLLLVGEREGRRVAVLPFDLHQSDLPLLPAFPILIKQLEDYLLPNAGGSLGEALVGSRVGLLPPIRENGWRVTAPDGEVERVDRAMIEQGFTPNLPGLYTFASEDKKETRLLSAVLPPTESVLKPTQVALPTDAEDEQESGVLSPASAASGQRDIWPFIAIAALLLCFVEWEVYKRGG